MTFDYCNNLTRDNLDLKLTWDLEGEKMAVLEALQVHMTLPEYSKHAASGILRMSDYPVLIRIVTGSDSELQNTKF